MDPFALLPVLVIAVVGLLVWRARRPAVWGDVPDNVRLQTDADGLLIVPVRQLKRFGLLNSSQNGLSPALRLGRDALRVKVFKPYDWPFAEIRLVDARKTLFGGPALIFRGHGINQAVIATLPDPGTARATLRALPRTLPMTPAATRLRDG